MQTPAGSTLASGSAGVTGASARFEVRSEAYGGRSGFGVRRTLSPQAAPLFIAKPKLIAAALLAR